MLFFRMRYYILYRMKSVQNLFTSAYFLRTLFKQPVGRFHFGNHFLTSNNTLEVMGKRGRPRKRTDSAGYDSDASNESAGGSKRKYSRGSTDSATEEEEDENENMNSKLAKMLLEVGEYERDVNRERFKYVAYRKAAAAIAQHPEPITSGRQARQLEGIGKSIAEKIDEIVSTGKLGKLEEIKKDKHGHQIQELTKITGIGPVAAKELYDKGIRSIEDLRKHPDELTHQQQVALKYYEELEEEEPIPKEEISAIGDYIKKVMAHLDTDYELTLCGGYRRGEATSDDIDIMINHPSVKSNSPLEHKQEMFQKVIKALQKSGFLTDTLTMGDSRFTGICLLAYDMLPESSKLSGGKFVHRRIQIRMVPQDEYFFGLLHLTGTSEFNRQMRLHAKEYGYRLSEHGLRKLSHLGKTGARIPVSSERDIFDRIGMDYRTPEDRSI